MAGSNTTTKPLAVSLAACAVLPHVSHKVSKRQGPADMSYSSAGNNPYIHDRASRSLTCAARQSLSAPACPKHPPRALPAC